MTLAAALFLVAAFLVIAWLVRMPARAREVIARSRGALADLRNPELDDRAKERAVQSHALRLLVLFLVLTASAALALGVPFLVIALLDSAGVLNADAVVDLTLSPVFLIGTSVGGFAIWLALRSART